MLTYHCKFMKDASGGVMIFFATTLLVLVIAVGLAIDLARTQLIQSRVQTSLDAATLAAGVKINARNPQTVFDQYFNGNLPLNTMGATFGLPIIDAYDADGNLVADLDDPVNRSRVEILNVRVEGELPSTSLALVGVPATEIFAESEVQVNRRTAIEMVAVMDNSGSMEGTVSSAVGNVKKIDLLKTSMQSFFQQLYRDEPEDPNVKSALIPFDNRINYPAPQTPNQSSAQEALPREEHVPAIETGIVTQDWIDNFGFQPECLDVSYRDCVYAILLGGRQDRANLQSVQGFRTERSQLNSVLDGLKSVAYTNIDYAMEVASEALNPAFNSRFDHGSGLEPVAFSDSETIKAVVLITDANNEACGRNAVTGEYPAECITENANRDVQTRATCTTLKSQGVRIFTIALDFTPSNSLLRDCASGSEFFFQANDGEEFDRALSTILEAINNLRKTR